MQSSSRNYQYLGLLIIIWGSSFAMIYECLNGGFFSPEQTVGYRLAIGSVVLIFSCLICRKKFPNTPKPPVNSDDCKMALSLTGC